MQLRSIRKRQQMQEVVQTFVARWGKPTAYRWLAQPSRAGKRRWQVLAEAEGPQLLLDEASVALFDAPPRPERPVLESEPEEDGETGDESRSSHSHNNPVTIRRPRKVIQHSGEGSPSDTILGQSLRKNAVPSVK